MITYDITISRGMRGVSLADPFEVLLPSPPDILPLSVEEEEPVSAEENKTLEMLLENVMGLGRNLYEQQRQRLREMQQAAIELAVAVASRLVHERVEADAFPVENLVRSAIDHLEPEHAVTVYLHPQDLAVLEKRSGKESLGKEVEVRLVSDESLRRGDCRAETSDRCLLSRLDEQIGELRRHLLGSLGEAEIERRGSTPVRRFPDRRQMA